MSSFHQPPPHDNGGGNGVASAFGNRFLAPMKARRNNHNDQQNHHQPRDRLRRGVGTTSASTRFMNKQVSNVSSVPSLEVSNNTNKSYHVGGPHRRRERAGGGFSYHVTSHSTQHHSHNSSALQDRLMEMLVFELHENGAREFRTMTLRELYTHVMKAITTRPPSAEEEEEESEQKRESSIHSTKTTSSTASSSSKKREGSGMSVAESQSHLTKAPFPPPSNLPPPPQPPDSSKRIPRGPSLGTVTMPIPLPRPSTGTTTSGSSVTPLNASLPRTLPAGTSSSMLSNPTQNRNQSQTFSPVSPSASRGLIQPLPQQQQPQPQVPVFVPTSVPYRERLGGYLHPRDMRRLVTPFSNTNEPELMVRRHVMLINFDPLRAIVLRDRLLVLVPDGADAILMRIEKRLRGGLEELENDVYGDVQTTNSTATGSGVQDDDDPDKRVDADDNDDDHVEKNNRILMMDDDDDDDDHHDDDDNSEHSKNDKDDFMLDNGIYYNTSSKKKSFRSVFSETKKGSTTSSGGSAGGKKKPSSSSSFSMGESGTSIHSSTRGNQLSSRGNEATMMTDDPNTQPVADAATPDKATQSQLLQTQEDDNGISIKEEEEKEEEASASTASPKSISSPSSRMPPDLVQHSCSTVAECGEDEEQDEEDVAAAATVLDEALQTLSSPDEDKDPKDSSNNNDFESSGSSNSKKNIRIIPEQLAAAAEATAKLIGSPLPPAPPLLGSFSNAEDNNNSKDRSANEPTAATTTPGVEREDDNVGQPSPTSDGTPLVVDDGSVDDDDLAFFMEKKEDGTEEEEEGEEQNKDGDGGGNNDDNELQNNNIEELFDRDDAPDEWEDIDNRLFAELPFELLALDVVLEAVAALLLEDAGKLNQRANKIMKNVYSSKKQPEDRRRRRSSNGKKMSNGHETTHGIEQLRVLKDKVKGMDFRIKGFTRAIDQVLNDDEDMALMNLSRLLTHPERFIMPVSPDILNEESDEPELILEAYLQQALTASNSLELLSGQITTTEQLIDMKLDTIRNQLLFVNTAVSLVMLFVSVGSLIGAIFGMNLTNGLETSPTAFKYVVIGTSVSCVTLFTIFAFWFWKKNTWLLHA